MILSSHNQSLPKLERLKSKKIISLLFKEGSSIKIGCLQVLHLIVEDVSTPKVLFSVPKARIAKAYLRNLIKRRMREAYRLNKNRICNQISRSSSLVIGIVFLHTSLCSYKQIEMSLLAHIALVNSKLNYAN